MHLDILRYVQLFSAQQVTQFSLHPSEDFILICYGIGLVQLATLIRNAFYTYFETISESTQQ